MKRAYIFNPAAGHCRHRPDLERALRALVAARDPGATFQATRQPGHATELARQAAVAGCDAVVAIGGDGTINEVAQALIGTEIALGIAPCGSGNGLARHLGLPRSVEAALRLVVEGPVRRGRIDTGVVNMYPFLNVMGLGLDAEVARRFNGLDRRGLPAYFGAALEAFRRRRAEPLVIACDGRRAIHALVLLAIANSDEYGNGACIAPGARTDDGVLDLVGVRPVGWTGAATLGVRLFTRSIGRSARVIRASGRRIMIERAAGGWIHTDGEPRRAGASLDVSVRPRSLTVLVPARSRYPSAPTPLPAVAGEHPTSPR